MSHSQGEQQGAKKMPATRASAPPPAFLQHLMARVDPHQAARNDALLRAQRACGRWIGLRRLHIGVSSQVLAGMIGATAEDLMLIETGMADPEQISEDARKSLGLRLMQSPADKAWSTDVIAIALGRIEALSEATLDRVFSELEVASISPQARDQMLADNLVLQPTSEHEALDMVDHDLLKGEPAMFAVLRVMINGATDIYKAVEQLRKDSVGIGILQVGVLLEHMQRERLIAAIGEQANPSFPDEIILSYQVTARGRRTFNAERTRRLVLEAKGASATSRGQNEDPNAQVLEGSG